MKAKRTLRALAAGLALCCAGVCAACGGETTETVPPAHEHSYGIWVTETEAGLFTEGTEYRVCTAEDCDAADKGREERTIPATGTTAGVKDAFTVYNDAIAATEIGFRLGQIKDDDSTYGAASYLGEADRVTEFGTGATTISFTLDLTSFETGDCIVFSLNFVKKGTMDGAPANTYVTESLFGVLKTETGYTVAQVNNTTFSAADRDLIEASQNTKAVTDADGNITFGYRFSYDATAETDEEKLTSELLVNGEKALDFSVYISPDNTVRDMDGCGALWNCFASKDTAVLYNLVKS